MKLVHEHWTDGSEGGDTFCLSGPAGDGVRATLVGNAKLVWTCEAESNFEAMTKYYQHQGWGIYSSDCAESDRCTYTDELGNTSYPK